MLEWITFKDLAEEARESDCEKVKMAAQAQKIASLNLHECTQDDVFLATGHSDKDNENPSSSGISMLMTQLTSNSEQYKQTEVFIQAQEEVHAAHLVSDEIVKLLIDVLRQGLLG
ncbi:hypothetical protein BU17DRAFT_98077 [Hysterangium stoloniferum]|nr:hypothetical protein BU17DRAFT_98077 [Hysterangium stoloniferum]